MTIADLKKEIDGLIREKEEDLHKRPYQPVCPGCGKEYDYCPVCGRRTHFYPKTIWYYTNTNNSRYL